MESQKKGLIGLLIKSGLAKNVSQATLILGAAAVASIIVTLFLIFSGGSPGEKYGNFNEMYEQNPDLFN